MQTDASKSTPSPSPATAPAGAWLWSREAGNYVRVPEPRRFELHPIAETERRFHALARGERVEVAAPTFLLWAPEFYEHADRIHHRGSVVVALDAAAHDRAAELWLDGKPYVFLGDRTRALPAWLLAHLAGCAIWFTYDGASLHALRSVHLAGGLYVVDLERVVA